jgi:hypothetical protein
MALCPVPFLALREGRDAQSAPLNVVHNWGILRWMMKKMILLLMRKNSKRCRWVHSCRSVHVGINVRLLGQNRRYSCEACQETQRVKEDQGGEHFRIESTTTVGSRLRLDPCYCSQCTRCSGRRQSLPIHAEFFFKKDDNN